METITRAEARRQGAKRYFTGKPCLRGHIAERQVSNLTCLECNLEKVRARQWHKNNPERAKENRRRWREANPEKVAAARERQAACPKAKERAARWYAENREQRCASMKAYREANREKIDATHKVWVEANRDRVRELFRMARQRRRARMRGSNGSHTSADLVEILAAQKGRCAYCRVDLRKVKKQVDHIIPLARGGSNARANIQYLCASCNQAKNAADPIDFARERGLLI